MTITCDPSDRCVVISVKNQSEGKVLAYSFISISLIVIEYKTTQQLSNIRVDLTLVGLSVMFVITRESRPLGKRQNYQVTYQETMLALRRGKFRAFLKPTNSTVNKGYDGNSFTNSHDYEISLEIAVGPKGQLVCSLTYMKRQFN